MIAHPPQLQKAYKRYCAGDLRNKHLVLCDGGVMASTILAIANVKSGIKGPQAENLSGEAFPALESKAYSRKVTVFLVTVGLDVGGTEGQLMELADHIDPGRFVVTVVALKGEGAIARKMRSRGIRVVPLNGTGRMDARAFLRFYSLVRAEQPDIIHSFLPLANYVGMIVGYMLRVSVLVASYRGVEQGRREFHVWVDRLVVRLAQATTCCSDAVRWFAIQRFGGEKPKYVTIYNGVDVEQFRCASTITKSDLGLREGRATIGVVCRLDEPTKGLAVLLKGIAQLNQISNIPPFQLLIVGDGPSANGLRRLSEELGLNEIVVFAGLRCDVEQILPLFDLFVLPSLSEGFGIALVEAMAAGCPVVATAVGGIPEVVQTGRTGVLVPAGDSNALTDALADLLKDRSKARVLGRAGQRWVFTKFAVSTMVHHHESLYERLLQEAGVCNGPVTKAMVRV
jgi:glycosyltransferase involved in cell wall biosynthesis